MKRSVVALAFVVLAVLCMAGNALAVQENIGGVGVTRVKGNQTR